MFDVPLLHVVESQLRDRLLRGVQDSASGGRTMEGMTKERVLALELEQLPYCLGAARAALTDLERLLRQLPEVVLAGFPQQLTSGALIGLAPHQSLPISWRVDQFLDAARRAQNALTRYVARTFSASLPLSLSDLVANLDRLRTKVPDPVAAELTSYWKDHGATLKAYRDLAQHYAVVSSDAYVRLPAQGAPMVRLLLPTDPADRSLARIAYEPPYTFVGAYCRSSFMELYQLACVLAHLLLQHLGNPKQVTLNLLRHPITFGRKEGFAGLPSDDLEASIQAAANEANTRALERFGPIPEVAT